MHSGIDNIADGAERKRALNTDESFIVRAPAGSGKTRLLIQRYLALLATVDSPEEVIAITFTRKAAAEMRARVMKAFKAVDNTSIEEDAVTHTLAKHVLQIDAAREDSARWNLMANQSRLRIQTIDSLNATLTRQMPLLARFGAQPESVEDASALYSQAAANLLDQINDDSDIANDLATLLTHLDNNLNVVERLIAEMLAARDHWLRHLSKMHAREMLEAALARVSLRALNDVVAHYPAAEKAETLGLMRFSSQNLPEEQAGRALSIGAGMHDFPHATIDDLPAWLGVADLLMTKANEWRNPKGINKNMGFPATDKKMKDRLRALLETLANGDAATALLAALGDLRAVPPPRYSQQEWDVLGAIVRLLPHATAHLWDVFSREAQCDFTEIAQAASRALGDDDAPTDLALALDYRVRHLLVDEFQDTSYAQFALLEKLTRGWSEGDGRTLFVVGDPMQSIYRFREAEVGLFLRARASGIGSVALTPLTLSVNFRSQPTIIEWVNQTFGQVMPAEDSTFTATANVPYSQSVAFNQVEANERSIVDCHWTFDAGEEDRDCNVIEANEIIQRILQTQQDRVDASIAILTRNRGHLAAIIPALKAANIAYVAVDIDPLNDRPVVQDLFALTRAMLNVADRIAWLAVLRAPWCGLTLNDLAALTHSAAPINGALTPDARTIWEMLNDETRLEALTDDGRARAIACRNVMAHALKLRQQMNLRDAVEQAWLQLGGSACLTAAHQLDDANAYLNLLEAEANVQANGRSIIDINMLETRVNRLFSGSRPAAREGVVQVMTIHKAKGLEFDTVIVPGLHRPPRHDDKKLLAWSEATNDETGERELLLAPIRETGADDDTDQIYKYIASQDRMKALNENVRLMYVAATRAERQLFLFGTLKIKNSDDGDELSAPPAMSLLAAIWPALSDSALSASTSRSSNQSSTVGTESKVDSPTTNHAMRIAFPLILPEMRDAVVIDNLPLQPTATTASIIDFEWASDTARHIGTIVHAYLQTIAEDGLNHWSAKRLDASRAAIAQALLQLGTAETEINTAATRILDALKKTLNDTRGQWILQPHRDVRAEWRLTGILDGKRTNIAIDRTFIDEEGTRWIIDFKTGNHEGADVDAFLDNEVKRYSTQLATYAKLVSAMSAEGVPIKLGLYFPLLGGWREWTF
jgi:ATP-dependent helicase/nuclease subunit A